MYIKNITNCINNPIQIPTNDMHCWYRSKDYKPLLGQKIIYSEDFSNFTLGSNFNGVDNWVLSSNSNSDIKISNIAQSTDINPPAITFIGTGMGQSASKIFTNDYLKSGSITYCGCVAPYETGQQAIQFQLMEDNTALAYISLKYIYSSTGGLNSRYIYFGTTELYNTTVGTTLRWNSANTSYYKIRINWYKNNTYSIWIAEWNNTATSTKVYDNLYSSDIIRPSGTLSNNTVNLNPVVLTGINPWTNGVNKFRIISSQYFVGTEYFTNIEVSTSEYDTPSFGIMDSSGNDNHASLISIGEVNLSTYYNSINSYLPKYPLCFNHHSGTTIASYGYWNETTQQLQMPDIDFSNGFTISFMMNRTWSLAGQTPFYLNFISKNPTNTHNCIRLFSVGTATTLTTLIKNNSDGNIVSHTSSSGVCPLNTWCHFIITLDSSGNFKILKNGTVVTGTAQSSIVIPNTPRQCYFSNFGYLDEIMVWKRGLTDGELSNLATLFTPWLS